MTVLFYTSMYEKCYAIRNNTEWIAANIECCIISSCWHSVSLNNPVVGSGQPLSVRRPGGTLQTSLKTSTGTIINVLYRRTAKCVVKYWDLDSGNYELSIIIRTKIAPYLQKSFTRITRYSAATEGTGITSNTAPVNPTFRGQGTFLSGRWFLVFHHEGEEYMLQASTCFTSR